MTKFKVLTDRLNTFFTNNKITTGNSIPTSGEWNVGDICISSIQENGECGWICTESGTPGKWEIFGSGGSGKLVSLSSSVEVTGPVTEVSLTGLGTNVSENDKLFVHYNSTHLLEGVDFEIISNGTKIRKLNGGSWNESSSNAMFAFELLKHVKKVNGDNILLDSKMCVLKSNKTISAPTSEVEIGIEGFNKDSDYLTVYVNSTYLTEGVDYNISSDSRKIVSLNGNWNEESLSDYRFSFVVIKEVGIINPDAVVGTENLKDSSVTIDKLGEDVIERLDEFDSQLELNVIDIDNNGFNARKFYNGDWSDAINEAINYSYSKGYGKVILPGGELLITKPIVIKQGIKLVGQSRVSTVLKVESDYSDYVIKVVGGGSTNTSVNRFSMENIKIDLNKSTSLGGIMCDWCYILQMINVEVSNSLNPNTKLFYLSNVFNCLLVSCRASANNNNDGTGFYITSTKNGENVTQVKLTDCLAQYCGIGVHINLLTGGSEISYENGGLGKNTTNILIEGNTTNVDIRLNHIELAENGIILNGQNLRCVNIELNDFYDVVNSIVINDGVRYVDIKSNRFNGNRNGGTVLTCNGNVLGVTFYNNDILEDNYNVFAIGHNLISVRDEHEIIHNNNISSIPYLGYKVKHYRFNNTSNVQIGDLPASYHGHTITFYFDDFSRFYEGSRLRIQRAIGLSENNITMKYNAIDNKWYEVSRYEKSMGSKPTTGNFSGGMLVWNNNRVNTSALYWVYINGAWKDFNTISY